MAHVTITLTSNLFTRSGFDTRHSMLNMETQNESHPA